MKIIFKKTEVHDLKIDIVKTKLCIGDELEISDDTQGVTDLFFYKKNGFFAKLLGRKKLKALGSLSAEDSGKLIQKLHGSHKSRVRVVDILPKHLSKVGYDRVYVSVWIG